MKLSNRMLWIIILLWFVLSFYWFYKYFFELKLINLEIKSNVSTFSWSIYNSKYEKSFFCNEKKCIIKEIPPFEYEFIIYKEGYKNFKYIINTGKNNSIVINLEKDIKLKEIKQKKLSRKELINKIKNNNNKIIEFSWAKFNYNEIYWNKDFVYFKQNNKLYFYNLLNNNSFNIEFKTDINYIKDIEKNKLLIVTNLWSFTFNLLNKKIEYFSLFSDFILLDNNYIWIINSGDLIRKKNFWYEWVWWDLLISYNIINKKSYILKNISQNIKKIYIQDWINFIEDNIWNKYEIVWY